jgi:hypothetical protein
MWVLLRPHDSEEPSHASDHDNRFGYCEVGFSGSRRRAEGNVILRRFVAFLAGQSIDQTKLDQRPERGSNAVVTIVVPERLKRVGREIEILIDNSDDARHPTQAC